MTIVRTHSRTTYNKLVTNALRDGWRHERVYLSDVYKEGASLQRGHDSLVIVYHDPKHIGFSWLPDTTKAQYLP